MVLHSNIAQDAYRDNMLLPPLTDAHYVMVLLDREVARLLDIQVRRGSSRQVTPCAISARGPQLRHAAPIADAGGRTTFHSALIGKLRRTGAVVIVGHGVGAAVVVADLLAELREGHPCLSRRVIAAIPLLNSHPTSERLLELAKTVFRQGEACSTAG